MEVDAPDGPAALELERRLAHLHSSTVFRGRSWYVQVGDEGTPDEIEPVVEAWLADIGERHTKVRLPGQEWRVEAQPRKRRRLR